MRALVVEDEALVAMIAEEALSALGFKHRSARNAAEAISEFEAHEPDMALIDVGLPDGKGDDLAERLRLAAPNLRVVMASGYDPARLRHRFRHDPKVAVLSKPYTEGDLARAARSLGFTVPD